jgi:hypothetical protein
MNLPTVVIAGTTYTILFPDLVRPLNTGERLTLRESIRTCGIRVPVAIDEDNGIIDGGNRAQIAEELGLASLRTETHPGLTLEQKAELAISLNAHRRHLTQRDRQELHEQRNQRIARIVEQRQSGESIRAIAEMEGVSPGQVQRDLGAAATVSPDTVQPRDGQVKGRDGKRRRARKSIPPTRTPSIPTAAPPAEPPAATPATMPDCAPPDDTPAACAPAEELAPASTKDTQQAALRWIRRAEDVLLDLAKRAKGAKQVKAADRLAAAEVLRQELLRWLDNLTREQLLTPTGRKPTQVPKRKPSGEIKGGRVHRAADPLQRFLSEAWLPNRHGLDEDQHLR